MKRAAIASLYAALIALLAFAQPLGAANVRLPSLPSRAQLNSPVSTADTSTEHNWLLSLMPAARNMEAPDWVTEGLRAYYRVAADTVENPFRDEPVVIAPTPRAGELNSAPAIMRTDVVALASRYAATSSTIFVGQPPIPWSDVFSTGYPGICDFWVNINAVKALQMSLPAGVYTSATAYVSSSGVHPAIRVDYAPAGAGHYFTWLFDSDTGLVLYQAEWIVLKDDRYAHVVVAEFVSKRYVTLPWTSGVAPSWVVPGTSFSYQGSIRTWSPATGFSLPIPAVLNVEILSADRKWSSVRIQRMFSGAMEDSAIQAHSGTGTLTGGFWIPRTGPLKMEAGDILDAFDPVIGSTVEVAYVGYASYNSPVVTIFEWAEKYKRAWIYRIDDGMLLYWLDEKVVDPSTGTVQRAEWQLIEDRPEEPEVSPTP